MKFTIERDAFLRTLGHATGVVERRNTIPILANVLIAANGEFVSVTATDLDIEIVELVAAKVETGGSVTVSGHMLHDMLRKLPAGAEIAVETTGENGGQVKVSAGKAKYVVSSLPAEDFPQMQKFGVGPVTTFELPASDWRRLLDKTKFAISTEETRFYLNGIFLCVAENGDHVLRAVATNGHVMSRCDAPLPDGADSMPGVILPRKTCLELRKLIGEHEGNVAVTVSGVKIAFAFGSIALTSKLIDGTFPDYNRVVPKPGPVEMIVPTSELDSAIERVGVISGDKTRAAAFHLADSALSICCNNADGQEATDQIDAEHKGKLSIGFNQRYVTDILGNIDGKTTKFNFTDAGSPALVTDPEDEAALFVIMPMRF